ELPLEELYYFKVDPPHGFGVQVVYSAERNLDVAYRVQDGDVVLIPFGYHPSAAAPGYRLYYLWALAGEERGLAYRDDPLHAWVRAR
ncbi:MAG: 5-deoxy-glucuronate isomerase, partial [Armatimonadota bacterium]|nr:5-deoxy-glucuronate isomerase [Armatimonadota bacterium]